MSMQKEIVARGSMRTAVWCFLTKMAMQWGIVCMPFIIFTASICPDVVHILVGKLIVYSVALAAIATFIMMQGRVFANEQGVGYRNKLIFQNYSINWKDLEFSKPFLLTLEKPIVLKRKGTKDFVKIWTTMNGYQELKGFLAQRNILLDSGAIEQKAQQQFRAFDDVLKESLGPQ